MSKLLQRLSDAAKSGVYRTAHGDDILQATKASGLQVARIDLAGAGKEALLARIARALSFPQWFGGNWDALEDCLADLSSSQAIGHVLLFEGRSDLAADEMGILVDILGSVAAASAERKRPFFAVFVKGPPALPELYKSGK
jgi:biotin synthase-related radical SAM superfamily protein